MLVLCILGFITSLYLIYNHYSLESTACDFGNLVSCSIVNSSIFSELFNVPVALFGALWFVVLAVITFQSFKKKHYLAYSLVWNIVGILFVFYLVWAETFLGALCPYCTVVHIIITLTLILSIILFMAEKAALSFKLLSLGRSFILAIVVIYLLAVLLFNIPWSGKNNYDLEAQCITEKGVNMYGSFRCGVCAKTRAMFGDSFQYINEIECHPQGENSQTELCLQKGIKLTPTWILEPMGVEQKRQEGFRSVDELKVFAGCEVEP